MATYETYETDAVYDDMDLSPEKVAKAVNPRPKIERRSSNKKMTILLAATFAILLLLLLAIGGGVAVFLKSNFRESDDCDVGPWGPWTSCYVPPGTCGVGKQNRTREKIADATNKGT